MGPCKATTVSRTFWTQKLNFSPYPGCGHDGFARAGLLRVCPRVADTRRNRLLQSHHCFLQAAPDIGPGRSPNRIRFRAQAPLRHPFQAAGGKQKAHLRSPEQSRLRQCVPHSTRETRCRASPKLVRFGGFLRFFGDFQEIRERQTTSAPIRRALRVHRRDSEAPPSASTSRTGLPPAIHARVSLTFTSAARREAVLRALGSRPGGPGAGPAPALRPGGGPR